jgi:hypothetical protein
LQNWLKTPTLEALNRKLATVKRRFLRSQPSPPYHTQDYLNYGFLRYAGPQYRAFDE